MAHNGRCKVCGYHIRIQDLRGGSNITAVSMAVPFLLWLLPIPIFSAVFMKWAGPKFCGDACKQAWRQQHPLGWIWPFIVSHIIWPGIIVGILMFI